MEIFILFYFWLFLNPHAHKISHIHGISPGCSNALSLGIRLLRMSEILPSCGNCSETRAEPVYVKQYAISQKVREGLKPIINAFLEYGLLKNGKPPINTLILPVKKPDRSFHLILDLRGINLLMVTIHPTMTNLFTLMSLISHCKVLT